MARIARALRGTAQLFVMTGAACGSSGGSAKAPDGAIGIPAIDAAAAPDASPCAGATFYNVAEADGLIIPGSTQTFSTLTVANIGVGLSSLGLFRFNVGLLPATATLKDAHLNVAFAKQSGNCSTSCGSCLPLEASGDLSIFFMRSDWEEAKVTYSVRAGTSPWGAAGASQVGIDRSAAPVGTSAHVAGEDVRIELATADLADLNVFWRQGDRVSFLMTPSNGAIFIAATRESASEGCQGTGYPTAALVVDYCP